MCKGLLLRLLQRVQELTSLFFLLSLFAPHNLFDFVKILGLLKRGAVAMGGAQFHL
jgi:hypothetical protein